jgi:hypothetical protein
MECCTHLVAECEPLYRAALLNDLTNEFVAADETRRHVQVTAIEMQVAATKRRSRDLQNTVRLGLKFGIRLVFDGDFMWALVDDCSHRGG